MEYIRMAYAFYCLFLGLWTTKGQQERLNEAWSLVDVLIEDLGEHRKLDRYTLSCLTVAAGEMQGRVHLTNHVSFRGAYSPELNRILVNANELADTAEVVGILMHELTHAFQYRGGFGCQLLGMSISDAQLKKLKAQVKHYPKAEWEEEYEAHHVGNVAFNHIQARF